MKKSNAYLAVLMASLLGAAGAQAQSTSAAAPPDSPAVQAPVATKDAIRQEARGRSGATATWRVPGRAGELSTMVNGRANANPDDPQVAQYEVNRAARLMGNTGYVTPDNTGYAMPLGAPAYAPVGTPSVLQGGTPD